MNRQTYVTRMLWKVSNKKFSYVVKESKLENITKT